ncbi:MAG: thymidylate synthase [Lachnospiraceae bacterium]|nr:thymidylate synthase [Lachnospiraceae bacterium]
MHIIKEKTLGEAWLKTMKVVMNEGEDIWDEDVALREVRNLYITIDDIIDDDSVINKYADPDRVELMKKKYATCGLVGDYKMDYGSRIYNNHGINQIDWIVNRINQKPETKSATITLHEAGDEMLPCLSLLDFKYRNGVLDMNVVYRSQNIYWSHPGNMLALRQMQKDVANELNYKIGKVELVVFSAHIYESDFKRVKEIIEDTI